MTDPSATPTPAPSLSLPPGSMRAVVLAVALLAAVPRLWDLGGTPAGLFRDEAEKGYNAYSLARTGGVVEFPADERGVTRVRLRRPAALVDVAGSTTSLVYQYASVPFVALGGLHPGTTRMAAAFAGIAAVVGTAALLLRIWPWPCAIAAAVWFALCPWHLVFSRWALQGIFVPLAMVGVLGGLAGAERGRRWGFPLAGAALGFCFYAYSGAQPFCLLWGAALAALYGRKLRDRPMEAVAGVALFLAWAAPRMWVVAFGGGAGRLGSVAVWEEDDATLPLTAWRIASSWVAHFDPRFLFFRGDALPRHCVPGFGQLTPIDAVLLPAGLWATFRRKLPLRGALLAAFLLGPLGAAITWGHIPHSLRAIPMVVPAAIWGGVGLAEIATRLRGTAPASIGGGSMRRRAAATATVAAAAAVAIWVHARYFAIMRNDPAARDAFEAASLDAFRTATRERPPGARIFANGYIPYAAYFAVFCDRPDPRELSEHGFEGMGWIFFDPTLTPPARVVEAMAPGDRLITVDRELRARVWEK